MSNPSTLTLKLAAAVSNGVCLSQTPAGAGALTLNGSLVTAGVATLDTIARRVAIASTGSDAAVVFTLTGTDRGGNTQSETITGVTSATTQTSLRDYLTVTSVTSSAGTAGAITVGTNGVGSSTWVVDNFLARFWALAGVIVGPTGTVYTLEFTYDDPNGQGAVSLTDYPQQWSMNAGSNVPANAYAFSAITSQQGTNSFTFANQPIFAHRLTVNSGTGQVMMQSIQAGID